MSATGRGAPAQSATADREIVISRVISAPRELVFEAFTEVRHLSRWWGPEGFTTTTRAFEFRVGGEWDFVMHGPDGTDYQEWISWTEIAPPERIALLHGESRGDPNAFESVLTFAPDGAATRRPGSRCARCSPPRSCATRRSRSTTRSRAASRPSTTWLPTSRRSLGRVAVADDGQGVLQRVDVAGRLHRPRVPRGVDGAAVEGTAAVDIPAAVLPREPEARRGRRGRARQRHRAGDVRAHRRERDGQAHVRRRGAGVAGGGAVPHAGLRRDAREARPLGAAGWNHLPLRQRRHRDRALPGPRGRPRPGRPHRGRRRDDPGIRERGPDRRLLDRAVTRAVRLRNPPVRGRERGPRGPGAGPRGADAAGDPPDLRSPGAGTVSTSALPA